MKIYNLGSLNIDYVYRVDHFLQPGETYSAIDRNVFPGGKGLNQSVAAARAGAQVIHGAVVSSEGEFLVKVLSESGVDVSRLQRVDQPAGHTVIQVDRTGQNCILLFSGTNHCLNRQYIEGFLAYAQEGDILLLQNEINCLDVAFEIAKDRHMQIAFNPSPIHESIRKLPLEAVTWWFCNEIEAQALFGSDDLKKIAQVFRSQYPDAKLILTLGEHGSMFISREGIYQQPIYKVNAVDTTAAGDTYTGYFLSAVVAGNTIAEALQIAAKASAVAVSRPGAAVSIPYAAELK